MKNYNGITLTLMATGLLVVGCVTTQQTRNVKTTTFLSDYSHLSKGSAGEAQLLYISPNANWGGYKKVLVEPVRIYAEPSSKLAKLPVADQQALVDYLDAAVRKALQGDYAMAQSAGADVMRLRVAITDAKASKVLPDITSNIMPPMMLVSALKRVATGSNLAVGKARIEVEMLDSATGSQLAAAVDEHAGRKVFKGKLGKWNDTQAAFDHWAGRLKDRLATLRTK
jgi:hypothetical protein